MAVKWWDGYALGRDVSFYQGIVNHDNSLGITFDLIRAGQNTYTDPKFSINWQSSMGKRPRGAWWFYEWRSFGKSPEEQGAKFKSLGVLDGEIYPTMDFENPYSGWSTTPFPDRSAAYALMQRFKDATNAEKMILYCNESTLKSLRPFPNWLLDDWYLWIASPPKILNYTMDAWVYVTTPDDIPPTYKPQTYEWDWLFWQYTFKLYGPDHGVESLDLDGDMFHGTEEQMYMFFETDIYNPPDPGGDDTMGKYDNFPKIIWLNENSEPDVTKMQGTFDAALIYAGSGRNKASKFTDHLNVPYKFDKPSIAYVYVDFTEYEGMNLGPQYWWQNDPQNDPVIKTLDAQLRMASGAMRAVHAVVIDVTQIQLPGEGNKVMDGQYVAGVARDLVSKVWTRYKLPAYVAVRDLAWLDNFTGQGKDAMVSMLNDMNPIVTFSNITASGPYTWETLPSPPDDWKPAEVHAPGKFLTKYGQSVQLPGLTANLWLHVGTLSGFYDALNFKPSGGTVDPPVVEPPINDDDPSDKPPIIVPPATIPDGEMEKLLLVWYYIRQIVKVLTS